MLCVLILYISGGSYSLKSTPNDKFSEKLFLAALIYSQSFCQKSAERKPPKKYFSYFIFDDCPGIQSQAFASNKPTHHIVDPGDFFHTLVSIYY